MTDNLNGWTEGNRPNVSGNYAVIDDLYACMRFAFWNQSEARWSWDGQFRPITAVSYYRPAPGLPDKVKDRWRSADRDGF